MRLARTILTPGKIEPLDVVMFAAGLKDLPLNPFQDDTAEGVRPAPISRPPSLDVALWRRIPHAHRQSFIKKMAAGLRRGVHPDDTLSELLTSA